MNFNLYGLGRRTPQVDRGRPGVTFGDQTTPGVELILPDPTYIEAHAHRILGIVLTHAHEDHIGAVAWLWPRLKAPVYATPFTAFLLREKLREADLLDEVDITEVALGGKIELGPFSLELITLTHSIPEPNGLAIRTPLGTILHTGDWKIDPDPLLGAVTDQDAIRRLGDEGVLAMVCDSTNVFVDGHAGSKPTSADPDPLIGGLKARRGGLLRLQRGADGQRNPGGRGQRAPRLPGRSVHAPDGRGGEVGRTDGRHQAVP
jgi:ribonuclease J